MKNLFISLALLLFSLGLQAQENTSFNENKNEVGLVLTDFINGSFAFKYERLLGDHFSVVLTTGFKGKNGLIRLSGLDTENIKTSDLTYSGFKVIPEVRYYINKTQLGIMDGFYFGAYLKHSNLKSDLNGTYINDQNENFGIAFDVKFNITSVGFMVGYKYQVSNRFTFDFLIAGPGAGFHSYSINQRQALPDEFYDDLNEALSNYSLFDLQSSNFEFKSDRVKTKYTALSFRYGIALGYSF